MGHRKIGPSLIESHKWPGQNKEFCVVSPKFQQNNHEKLRQYTKVTQVGYTDSNTGEFVLVPEMVPELIVPDLSGFELKPYVSYKTDIEIQKRIETYEAKKLTYGSKIAVSKTVQDQKWPPQKIDAKVLFDIFYADKVRQEFNKIQIPQNDDA